MSRGKLVSLGIVLSCLHVAATVWIFGQLPLSTPRGPTPFERFLQYVLVVLHPTIAVGQWLPEGFAIILFLAFFAESLLWGFGIVWGILWIQRNYWGNKKRSILRQCD